MNRVPSMSQRNLALNPKQDKQVCARLSEWTLQVSEPPFTHSHDLKPQRNLQRQLQHSRRTAALMIRPREHAQRGKKDARPPVPSPGGPGKAVLRTRDHIQDREPDDRFQDRADPAAQW